MLYLAGAINTPRFFAKRAEDAAKDQTGALMDNNLAHTSKRIGRYKVLESEIFNQWSDHGNITILGLVIDVNPFRDHGGALITISLLGIETTVSIRDIRHWDRYKNKWIDPGPS